MPLNLRFLLPCFASLSLLFSCHSSTRLVDTVWADSLISHYTTPAIVTANTAEMDFWKKRINPASTGLVNEAKYAGTLVARFQQLGDIRDLKSADSLIRRVDSVYNHKEAGPMKSLVSYSIMEHRFAQASDWFEKAKLVGLKKDESAGLGFDVNFECGRYNNAANDLKQLRSTDDYAYFFRRSRYDHLEGNLDSAIAAMEEAARHADNIPVLIQVAESNVGDLYIHAGELPSARDKYLQVIAMRRGDFHSVIGMGWIALVNDHDDSLADRLFNFVHAHNQLPDALYRLEQVADFRRDSTEQVKRAYAFVQAATDSLYEKMYNRYLIELYTGILHQPKAAVDRAKAELDNRATPQTYAWYSYSLLANGQPDEAYKIFQTYVSGKPLEGLELYYMGRLMQALGERVQCTIFLQGRV